MDNIRKRLEAKEKALQDEVERGRRELEELKEMKKRIRKLKEEKREIRLKQQQMEVSSDSNLEKDLRELVTSRARGEEIYTPEMIIEQEEGEDSSSTENHCDEEMTLIENIKITKGKTFREVGRASMDVRIRLNTDIIKKQGRVFEIKGRISQAEKKAMIRVMSESEEEERDSLRERDSPIQIDKITRKIITTAEQAKKGEKKTEETTDKKEDPKAKPECSKTIDDKVAEKTTRIQIYKPGPKFTKRIVNKARKSMPKRQTEKPKMKQEKRRQSTKKGHMQTAKATARAAEIKKTLKQ